MEQLKNSLEISLYCTARAEGKAGYPCRSGDYAGRDKAIFEAGHKDGKAAIVRVSTIHRAAYLKAA